MIEISELTRRFGAAGIREVSFTCRPGTVTGFLGPNGAGKTTTMRLLCGLDRPDAGRAAIDGQPYARLPQPGRRVGVMLDPGAMHRGRTGRETLALAAAVLGADRTRVSRVLDLVGLDRGAAAKRVGQYSLGMRQRLALGIALLGDPGVLILDEPANGLDPVGVRWLRTFLRTKADAGCTVLVSSHLLAELALSADAVVIVKAGRLVAQGSVAELMAGGCSGVRVRTPQPAELRGALTARGFNSQSLGADQVIAHDVSCELVGHVAADSGVVVYEISTERRALEDAFLALIGEEGAA